MAMSEPPVAGASARGPRLKTAGWGWGAGVALVVLTLFTGVVPIWQYAAAQRPPDGVEVERAVVVGKSRGATLGSTAVRRNGSGIVDFRLPDGDTGGVAVDALATPPDRGEEIEVFRERGAWHSAEERSLWVLGFSILGLLFFGGLTGVWVVARLRGRVPGLPG